MSTNLTSIFGNELTVSAGAYQVDRQYSAFAGVDGMTAMNLGGRGNPVIVRGRLRSGVGSYSDGRFDVSLELEVLRGITYLPAKDYTFEGETFEQVVWDRLEPIINKNGKSFFMTSTGEVIIDFLAIGRTLI